MEKGTIMTIIFGGSAVTQATCQNCGNTVRFPTDHPHDYCAYCGKKILKIRGKDK